MSRACLQVSRPKFAWKEDSQSQLEGDLPALHIVEATQNKCGKDVTALVIISIMVQTKPLKYGR